MTPRFAASIEAVRGGAAQATPAECFGGLLLDRVEALVIRYLQTELHDTLPEQLLAAHHGKRTTPHFAHGSGGFNVNL